MVVGLVTVVVKLEAGSVMVVNNPRIDVVIVEAGSVRVLTSMSVVAEQGLLAG